jgi:hypothetical protein
MSLGWIVSLQNWNGHQLFAGKKTPKTTTKWFAERGEAEAHKAALRQQYPDVDTVLICCSLAPSVQKKRRR